MLSDWLNNSAIVNLIIIILTLATLVFTIVSSDKSVSFLKKISKFLGSCIVGILVMSIKVFLSSVIIGLLQDNLDLTLIWLRYFSNPFMFEILVVIPGILIAIIASSGVNQQEVTKRSVASAVIIIFAVNVLTSSTVYSLPCLSVEVVTSLIAGLTIAVLLRAFNLWSYRGGFSIGYKRE